MKPWNKGKAIGQKRPLQPEQVALLRHALRQQDAIRDLALFEVALSTMLRSSDVLSLQYDDVVGYDGAIVKTMLMRMAKTGHTVKVFLGKAAQEVLADWIAKAELVHGHYLFTSLHNSHGPPLTTFSYRRIVKTWATLIHADPKQFSTHSLRRTKAAEMYRETGNLRAIQILLGHQNIAMTQRYLGIEEADALALAEKYEM